MKKHDMHRRCSIENGRTFLMLHSSNMITAQRFNAGEIEHHNERVPARQNASFLSALSGPESCCDMLPSLKRLGYNH